MTAPIHNQCLCAVVPKTVGRRGENGDWWASWPRSQRRCAEFPRRSVGKQRKIPIVKRGGLDGPDREEAGDFQSLRLHGSRRCRKSARSAPLLGAAHVANQDALEGDLSCKTIVAEQAGDFVGVGVKSAAARLRRAVAGENFRCEKFLDLP